MHLKKVDRNLLKDWTMKVNAILKKVGLKQNQRGRNAVKEP